MNFKICKKVAKCYIFKSYHFLPSTGVEETTKSDPSPVDKKKHIFSQSDIH